MTNLHTRLLLAANPLTQHTQLSPIIIGPVCAHAQALQEGVHVYVEWNSWNDALSYPARARSGKG